VKVDGYAIGPKDYGDVADKIKSGSIKIANDGSGDTAAYRVPHKRIDVPFQGPLSGLQKALIIHEATHAACDVKRFSMMSRLTSETLAYLAQGISLNKQSNIVLPEGKARDVIATAMRVSGRMLSAKSPTPTPADLDELRAAISRDPLYAYQPVAPQLLDITMAARGARGLNDGDMDALNRAMQFDWWNSQTWINSPQGYNGVP
jgi:hypothetical protein